MMSGSILVTMLIGIVASLPLGCPAFHNTETAISQIADLGNGFLVFIHFLYYNSWSYETVCVFSILFDTYLE